MYYATNEYNNDGELSHCDFYYSVMFLSLYFEVIKILVGFPLYVGI